MSNNPGNKLVSGVEMPLDGLNTPLNPRRFVISIRDTQGVDEDETRYGDRFMLVMLKREPGVLAPTYTAETTSAGMDDNLAIMAIRHVYADASEEKE